MAPAPRQYDAARWQARRMAGRLELAGTTAPGKRAQPPLELARPLPCTVHYCTTSLRRHPTRKRGTLQDLAAQICEAMRGFQRRRRAEEATALPPPGPSQDQAPSWHPSTTLHPRLPHQTVHIKPRAL
jgi:hypothetical protein